MPQGGLDNVVNMFLYLCNEYLVTTGIQPATPKETPPLGLYHPDYGESPVMTHHWLHDTLFLFLPE